VDPKFRESITHIPHRICGRRLRPLCAAYIAALEGARSPLFSADPEQSITPEDLLYALEVCVSPVDPLTLQPRGVLQPRWHLLDTWRVVAWRFRPASFQRALEQWFAYYRDYVNLPQMMEPIGPAESAATYHAGGGLTGPPQLARVCSVLKQYPGAITEHRAWTMPYGLLVWVDEQGRELDGGGRKFWDTEKDAALDAALEKAEEAGAKLKR
jgi:hypothetical protein